MAELPVIKKQYASMYVPSLAKKIKYKLLTAGDEIDLSLAHEEYRNTIISLSDDIDEVEFARIYDEANNELLERILEIFERLFEDGFDTSKITEGDLEIILKEVKLNSIENITKINLRCPNCGAYTPKEFDLNTLQPKKVEPFKIIKLDDKFKLKIQHIPVKYRKLIQSDKLSHIQQDVLALSLFSIESPDDGVLYFEDFSDEDRKEWFRENISSDIKKEMTQFLEDKPGFEPVKLKTICTHKLDDNGNPLSIVDLKNIANANKEAMLQGKEDKVVGMEKYKVCGTEIEAEYDSFLQYFF